MVCENVVKREHQSNGFDYDGWGISGPMKGSWLSKLMNAKLWSPCPEDLNQSKWSIFYIVGMEVIGKGN